MTREHYRNGDTIDLTECGCDGCSPSLVNGVLCHEAGCPDSWKDTEKTCFECGYGFLPDNRWDRTCQDCQRFADPDDRWDDEPEDDDE